MLVVIGGAGNLGQHLIEFFIQQHIDLILIENDEIKIDRIKSRHDLMIIKGDMLSHFVLRSANVAACDLFIACSSIDSTNIVSCQLAKRLGAKHSVARIYSESIFPYENNDLEECFGVDWLVSPSLLTGYRLANFLFDDANFSFDSYFGAKMNISRIKITADSPCLGEIPSKVISLKSKDIKLVCIYRNNEILDVNAFQTKQIVFEKEDYVVLISLDKVNSKLFDDFHVNKYSKKKIYIAGVSPSTYTMLSILQKEKRNNKITIFENSLETCEKIMQQYNVKTINLDPADFGEIKKFDPDLDGIFICTSENDADNLTYALNAQQMGFKYIVPLVNEFDKMRLFKYFSSFKSISPPELSAREIHRFFNQEILSGFELIKGSKATGVVKTIEKGSKWINEKLLKLMEKFITLDSSLKILCIWEDEKIRLYHQGDDFEIKEGNKLLIVSLEGDETHLEKILSN